MKPRTGFSFSIKDELVTTIDKVQDKLLGDVKTYSVDEKNELEAMRRAIEAILTKLRSMDLFMRQGMYRYRGVVMDGEEYQKEIIKEFLQDMRQGKYTNEQLKLLTGESK
jgi:hypothetical protein